MWELDQGMMTVLSRNWWMLAIRGLAALIFGLLAIFWPGITLATLVLFYGAYVFVDGIFAIIAAINRAEHKTSWVPLLLLGVVSIAAGLLTFFWPGITAIALLSLIAVWAIFTGVFEIVAAIRLRELIRNEWLLVLSGIVSVLFGLAMVIFPAAGALAVAWLIGVYAIVYGILLMAFAFRLHQSGASLALNT